MKGDKRQIVEDYKDSNGITKEVEVQVYKGLVGIHVDESEISFIDGVNGKLVYRGYSIEELVEKSTFEEVAYLLIYGELPTKSQIAEFNDQLIKERVLPDNIVRILQSFPRNTTRIELLRTAISALSLYDPDDYNYSEEANIRKGIRIIAKMPTIIAFAHRIQTNQSFVDPSQKLNYAANYYYMMTGDNPTDDFTEAFDDVLICHADHANNASTFSCRVTVSTLSDLYSGITSAIGTLRGPLHGGANEAVMKAFTYEVKKNENVISWAQKKLEEKEKIMGFGHRVYKTWDPRAIIMRNLAKKFYEAYKEGERLDKITETGHDHQHDDFIFEMTEILTEFMIKTKGIYPNVDLYSAGVLHSLGIPMALYTPLFAASRSVGWVSNAIEQLKDNKLIRPRLKYIGNHNKVYKDIDSR